MTCYNAEELDVYGVKRQDEIWNAITEYLLDIGDTETQIENIRRILLDKPTI